MGFLDEITKVMGGAASGGAAQGQGGLLESALGLINNPETGGLSGLIGMFTNKGLGNAVTSWVSTGENQATTGDEVARVLGNERIQEIAGKLGLSGSAVSTGLAALLPQVIDKLTPEGRVPEGGLLDQGLGLLKQRLPG